MRVFAIVVVLLLGCAGGLAAGSEAAMPGQSEVLTTCGSGHSAVLRAAPPSGLWCPHPNADDFDMSATDMPGLSATTSARFDLARVSSVGGPTDTSPGSGYPHSDKHPPRLHD